MKIVKRVVLIVLAFFIVVLGILIYVWRGEIFQFGNPIPYFARMVLLNDTTTFLQVNEIPKTYVTKKDNYETMLKTLTEKNGLVLKSQEGDEYVYSSKTLLLTIEGKSYFGNYTVWTVRALENEEFPERLK